MPFPLTPAPLRGGGVEVTTWTSVAAPFIVVKGTVELGREEKFAFVRLGNNYCHASMTRSPCSVHLDLDRQQPPAEVSGPPAIFTL